MFILCDPDTVWRSQLRDRLPHTASVMELESLPAARAALDDVVEPATFILGPSLDPEAALTLAEAITVSDRAASVILSWENPDPQLMRKALRAGVVDVLPPDTSDDELGDALARARVEATYQRATAQPTDDDGTLGNVITVFSTKGGSGKSLVATNLAVLIEQHQDGDVALVDLNLQSGDLAIMLQLMPSLSIYEAAQSIERMDADALKGYLTRHDSGVSLLAAPLEPSLAEAVSSDAVTRLIHLLREHFSYVVIDGPSFFTDQILAAIDLSDQVILVGSLDVPSVKSLRMALNTLHQLGRPRDQILTVLNRADSSVGLRAAEVEKSLGTSIDVRLPSSRDVPLSINQGTPLAADRRRSDVVRAIAELLPKLINQPTKDTASGRGGLFGRRR